MRRAILGILAGVLLVGCGGGEDGSTSSGDPLAGGDPAVGQELFLSNCAACHGAEGQGTDSGPPLVHEIYEPSHHGDASFLAAVQRGVEPHHWDFGPMPAIPGLEIDEVAHIVAYVRQLQREAGIE